MTQSKGLAGLILAFYLVVRFVFGQELDLLGSHASYVFEAVFVGAVMIFYRARVKVAFGALKSVIPDCLLALPLGFGVFKLAGVLGYGNPFDLTDKETLLFLLLLGPLLEEAIFRQALWYPLETLLPKPLVTVALTSLIFAFGHFHAYFSAQAEFHHFIIYQTIYALVIGVWWGYRYSTTRSLAVPVTLHLLFNLGYYLGFAL